MVGQKSPNVGIVMGSRRESPEPTEDGSRRESPEHTEDGSRRSSPDHKEKVIRNSQSTPDPAVSPVSSNWTPRRPSMDLTIRNAAAVRIQKVWRGWFIRRHVRLERLVHRMFTDLF
jgi:hypothetical protein